jgi:hypothetical protein
VQAFHSTFCSGRGLSPLQSHKPFGAGYPAEVEYHARREKPLNRSSNLTVCFRSTCKGRKQSLVCTMDNGSKVKLVIADGIVRADGEALNVIDPSLILDKHFVEFHVQLLTKSAIVAKHFIDLKTGDYSIKHQPLGGMLRTIAKGLCVAK